jgi:hypothetical protein
MRLSTRKASELLRRLSEPLQETRTAATVARIDSGRRPQQVALPSRKKVRIAAIFGNLAAKTKWRVFCS